MMDGTGAATWQAAYEAFGTRTAEQGVNAERHRANTKDEDPTGLLNEGLRYRDLATGVFISRDPAGFVDGPNVYTYVRQNPWSHYDPVGLFIAAIAEKLGERFGSNPVVEAIAPHTEVVVNTTQNTLEVASMVPALGKVADGLSAGISAADGNYAEAAATAGGGSAGKLLAKGVKALKQTGAAVVVVTGVVEETAKHGDEITTTAKSAREIAEQAAKQADEAASAVKTTGQNSAELGRNMALEGRAVGEGQAAAHIVPSTGTKGHWAKGAESRGLLQRYGVHINDASNGARLGHPRPHYQTHTAAFHNAINTRLHGLRDSMQEAGRGARAIRKALRQELRSIGPELEGR